MDKYGIDPEIFEKMKKICEKVAGFPIAQYNWNEIANKLTGNGALLKYDWAAIQEKIKTNSLIFSMSDEFREYANIVRESEGLSEEEFEKKFSAEIERSRELGRNGWIPSEHGNPRDFAEWSKYLHESPERIMEFFEEDDERVIKHIKHTLNSIYVEKPYVTYYQNGIKAFDNKDYMTAALYLTILFEIRISNLVEFPKKNAKNQRLRYQDKYSSYGYSIQKNKDLIFLIFIQLLRNIPIGCFALVIFHWIWNRILSQNLIIWIEHGCCMVGAAGKQQKRIVFS